MKVETVTYLRILGIFLLIGIVGAIKPVLFNEGSAAAKYVAKSSQLEMVNEAEVENYMESVLFGEGNVSIDEVTTPIETEEERSDIVENYFLIDSIIASVLFFAVVILLFPKVLWKTPAYHLLLIASAWIFIQAIGVSLNGGKKFSDLAVLAHATRWGLPLVFWLGVLRYKQEKSLDIVKLPAMIFCSLTFLVHGWEAFSLNPPFQDLLYNFGSLIGWDISPSVNTFILKTVGCMDIFLAIFLFVWRSHKLFLWMACWGLITAFSRPLTIGFDAWPEMAMRIANCGLPFFLYLIFKNATTVASEESKNTTPNVEINYEPQS